VSLAILAYMLEQPLQLALFLNTGTLVYYGWFFDPQFFLLTYVQAPFSTNLRAECTWPDMIVDCGILHGSVRSPSCFR
jgi:hypothetical protein